LVSLEGMYGYSFSVTPLEPTGSSTVLSASKEVGRTPLGGRFISSAAIGGIESADAAN
jgi:hypothetical protein